MIEIKIVLDDQGRVLVNGPLENKLLCLGLLDLARQTILTYNGEKEKIIKPNLVIPPIRQS